MGKLGRVIDVYLPNGEELTKVGFKIQIENEIIDVVEEQNLDNAKIYRDDFVIVEIRDEVIYNIKLISENDVDLGDEDE